jgi:DNA-binding transcriptional LysR family regulator
MPRRMELPELPLSQLRAFVVLAEELHFGHAAASLGIAQPPLSQQIRRLEHKVGHPLFRRAPGRVAITPAGRELLPVARRVLADLADGLAAARAVGDGRAGHLRIGFAASLALTVLPGLLRTFRQRYPDVQLDIREMTTAPQIAALQDGTIDVALLREPPADETGLGFETLLSEPFVAVLPSTHPLATRQAVPLARLADSPFVLLPRAVGPGLYDQIVGLCTAAGFTPRIAQHAVEWQTVCALVEAGLGISVAPACIRRIRLGGLAFPALEPGTARTRVAVGWRTEDPNPLVANMLTAVIGGASGNRAAHDAESRRA